MTDSTWPDEPHRRKTVLVLNEQDIDALDYEEGGAELLLNEEIYILSSSLKESNPVIQNLVDSGLVRPGAILIQNPFDMNMYENLVQAVEHFALEKYMHFSKLCMYLGAREVTVDQIEYKNTKGTEIYHFEGSVLMRGSGDGEVKNEEVVSLSNRLTLKNTFTGGESDAGAARELLKQTGLSGDVNMRSLIDMRRNPNNLLTSQKLQLNMTSEVKRNCNVLANLNIPACLSAKADYDRHESEQTEFTLTVKVDF